MSDLVIELFGRSVAGKAQHLTSVDARKPARARDEQEPEGAHAAEEEVVGALARPRLGGGERVQLEGADQIVRQDAELLPGTVGGVMLRGGDVQGELALELGEGFLLRPAPAGKGPQGG